MANSLLAHLYPRIKGSQEDVATIALQYLLSQSPDLNKAFTHLLEINLELDIGGCLRYTDYVNDNCISVDGIRLAIITWSEALERLSTVAASSAVEYLSDIQQLVGYCMQMDSDAFIPFSSDDLSAEVAKKADRYYSVIDEIISLLCADGNIKTSLKGLKATAYRKGYTRSIYIDEFALSINYDRDFWNSNGSVETPFWLSIRDLDWHQTQCFKDRMKAIPASKKEETLWNLTWLALEPKVNATMDEVCSDLKQQILNYLDLFR